MNGRARSLRIGMFTATVTAAFLTACGGEDDIVDTSHLDGSAGVAGSLIHDGSTDTGKAGTAGSRGTAGSSGTAGSGGASGGGGSAGAAGSEAGPSGTGGVTLDGAADGTTDAGTADAGTAGTSGLDASDSSATIADANAASDALGAVDATGAIDATGAVDATGAIDASSPDATTGTDAAPVDAARADATAGDGAVGDAPAPYCGDGITNGTEQCDHGSKNSNVFYSGCTTGCQQTSLIAWLDGADPNGDGSSITGGTAMSKWVDKARNNDALQGAITQQPSYIVAGINGVPGLVFDGSNDSLALPVDINYGALPNITVIAVFKNAPGSPAPYAGVWGQDNGGWDRFLVSGGNGQTGISNGTGFTAVTGLTADGVALVSVTTLRSGAASSVHVDGTLAASFTESHDNSGTTSVSVGDLNGPEAAPFGAFDGVISEIMIFDRALTAQERNTLGALLATKYGVTQYCGDGVKQGTEACDDGTNDGSLGCDADCTLSPSASIRLHCDATSQILQTFVGAGCHELVVTGGASYITFLTAATQAIIYPTTDCSGTVSLPVTADLNFCGVNFNDGSGVNDRVWSAFLSK